MSTGCSLGRECQELRLAGDDLAHEVDRYFHGLEPAPEKRRLMRRAVEAYFKARAVLVAAHEATVSRETA